MHRLARVYFATFYLPINEIHGLTSIHTWPGQRHTMLGISHRTEAVQNQKPLFIPLQTRWFRAFAKGIKPVEYRAYGPRWNERTCTVGRDVILSHGYSGDRIRAQVVRFDRIAIHNAPLEVQSLFANHAEIACISLNLGEHQPRQSRVT